MEKMMIEPGFGLRMLGFKGCAFNSYAVLVIQGSFYTMLKKRGGNESGYIVNVNIYAFNKYKPTVKVEDSSIYFLRSDKYNKQKCM